MLVSMLNSVRSGFLPVPLAGTPARSFAGMPVHLRTHGAFEAATATGMTAADRSMMLGHGEDLVYIRVRDHRLFAGQSEMAEVIYGTSLALAREMEEGFGVSGYVSQAVSSFVLGDERAFEHLFAVARRDFYTATHMVNVAVGMTVLARRLGYRSSTDLSLVCQAGLLHDMGKIHVPQEILNKPGRPTDAEWAEIRRHPQHGVDMMSPRGFHPLILRVAHEHHERLDGSGYPDGSRDIHPASMMCAVVDSFDAMTAMRPFKDRTMSVAQAAAELRACTPGKYDPEIVQAWLSLVEGRA